MKQYKDKHKKSQSYNESKIKQPELSPLVPVLPCKNALVNVIQ